MPVSTEETFTLTADQMATLPADIQEAMTLAKKPAKSADELSKDAAMADYEAGKDRQKTHEAMLAHAKAATAHRADGTSLDEEAEAAQKAGDTNTAAAKWDAARSARQRCNTHTESVMRHAASISGLPMPISRYGVEDDEFVTLRAWTQEKRDKLKKGEIKGEFAGPDESFPIAGPEDVNAAAKSLGRAKGDTDAIKASIIRIAKKFGWESGLPDAWKETKTAADPQDTILLANLITEDLIGDITDPAGAGLTNWIPCIYPGKWNGSDFTAAMIKEMAATFNPKAESCPVKIGHDGDDTQPQLTQIREVKIAPCKLTNGKTVDSCLWVRMDRTQEALASQKTYRHRSIEAWPPLHSSNPTPGKWNLKGLAFLGAAAPAVPALPPTALSATTILGGPTMPSTEITLEQEVKALKDKGEATLTALAQSTKEAAQLRTEKEDLEAKFAAQAKSLKAEAIKAELAEFKDKLLPAQMELLTPVILALDSDEPTITLSSSKTPVSVRTCLLAFLQGYKTHGLTNALEVPALSGKKMGDQSEEEMSEKDYIAKKVKEYQEKNKDAKMEKAIKYAQDCLKDRQNKAKK